MKTLLSQITSAGRIAIAASPDGMFHVVWKDAAVGSASTLRSALELACGRTWPGGAPIQVSTSPDDWYISA